MVQEWLLRVWSVSSILEGIVERPSSWEWQIPRVFSETINIILRAPLAEGRNELSQESIQATNRARCTDLGLRFRLLDICNEIHYQELCNRSSWLCIARVAIQPPFLVNAKLAGRENRIIAAVA